MSILILLEINSFVISLHQNCYKNIEGIQNFKYWLIIFMNVVLESQLFVNKNNNQVWICSCPIPMLTP